MSTLISAVSNHFVNENNVASCRTKAESLSQQTDNVGEPTRLSYPVKPSRMNRGGRGSPTMNCIMAETLVEDQQRD